MTDTTRIAFVLIGKVPINTPAAKMLCSLDLGFDGILVEACYTVTLTITGEVKPMQHYIDILTTAYTKIGWLDVMVFPEGMA